MSSSLARDLASRGNPYTALAAVISGALAFAVTYGGQTILLAPGRGLEVGLGLVESALAGGVSGWVTASVSGLEEAWSTTTDLGLFQFPWAIVVVLGTFWIISMLVAEWRND